MSTQSPASVLYSSDGTELAVVNNTGVVSASQRALLIAGVNPNNRTDFIPSSYVGALGISDMSSGTAVQVGTTVTTSGSFTLASSYVASQEIAIIVNVGTVTGAGSIKYTIQEVDPGDGVTLFGNSASTSVITSGNTPAVFTAVLNTTTSTAVVMTWTVTGTFSAAIYSTIVTKSTSSVQAISGSITANNSSVSLVATTPPADATYVGGLVNTTTPSGYTDGYMYPLSLTTDGLLRVDGSNVIQPVSGNATIVGTSTAGSNPTTGLITVQGTAGGTPLPVTVTGTIISDMDGYATSSAPVYINDTFNPLSLTLAGALRVDGSAVVQPVSGTVTVGSVSGTVTVTGTTTANQGLATTLSGAWPVEITDGYNVLGTSAFPIAVTGFVVTNKASTSAVTSVAITANANNALLTSNTNRIAATIYNNTTKTLYIKYGATASVASFSLQLLPNSYFEVQNDWNGEVDAFSPSGATGSVLCSELTA
jgi:hypothetical protein